MRLYTLMKLIIFPLLSLLSLRAFSQVNIKNTSLLVDSNIMYKDLDNWLTVSGTKEKITLVSKNGNSLSTYDNLRFNVRPTSLQPDTILIYSSKKLLLKKSFTIDTLGKLKFQLGNLEKDSASISEIIVNRGIRFIWKGSFYHYPIHIFSFNTAFVGPNADTLSTYILAEGNLLSNEQIAVIRTLTRNSKIIFERIIVGGPDSRRRETGPYVMVIK